MPTGQSPYVYRDDRLRVAVSSTTGCADLTDDVSSLVVATRLDAGLVNLQAPDQATAILVENDGDLAAAVNIEVRGGCLAVAGRVLLIDLAPRPREVRVLIMGQGRC